jgi:GcrA cell cycle regulator
MIWTEELIAKVRKMRADGIHAADIAEAMGMTKLAVLGAAHRYKLEPVNFQGSIGNHIVWTEERQALLRKLWIAGVMVTVIAQQFNCTPRSIQRAALRFNLRRRAPRKANTNGFRLPPRLEATVESVADQSIPQEQRKTFMELTGDTCHWPVGDPQEPDFFFCGAETEGRTYCPAHHRRSRE